jgi:hypothetical protein
MNNGTITEQHAVSFLESHPDITVNIEEKTVYYLAPGMPGSHGIGMGTWQKIDYLSLSHKYRVKPLALNRK